MANEKYAINLEAVKDLTKYLINLRKEWLHWAIMKYMIMLHLLEK